jgi:hypothetical protein
LENSVVNKSTKIRTTKIPQKAEQKENLPRAEKRENPTKSKPAESQPKTEEEKL